MVHKEVSRFAAEEDWTEREESKRVKERETTRGRGERRRRSRPRAYRRGCRSSCRSPSTCVPRTACARGPAAKPASSASRANCAEREGAVGGHKQPHSRSLALYFVLYVLLVENTDR
eukprot:scaffold110019_cov32-Tisochrysis_lutea.AAC.5